MWLGWQLCACVCEFITNCESLCMGGCLSLLQKRFFNNFKYVDGSTSLLTTPHSSQWH